MSDMIKVTDLGDRVRLQNGGSPTIGVMWDGKFFMSQQEAAKIAGVKAVTFSGQLKAGRPVKGKETAYASIDDVKKALPADKIALATKMPKSTNRRRDAAKKREAKKKAAQKKAKAPTEQTAPEPLLYGVRWPDGGVTLRLPGNQDFIWNLDSEEDIPWVWQGRVDWLF